jgi:hypothetical protein
VHGSGTDGTTETGTGWVVVEGTVVTGLPVVVVEEATLAPACSVRV